MEKNPWIEVNVVDPISRRGYRFLGKGELHRGYDIFDKATERIFAEEGTSYPVSTVVLIYVERALPIYSPRYIHISDEYAMRKMWKERRSRMEKQFESHIAKHRPYRPTSDQTRTD